MVLKRGGTPPEEESYITERQEKKKKKKKNEKEKKKKKKEQGFTADTSPGRRLAEPIIRQSAREGAPLILKKKTLVLGKGQSLETNE